MDDNKARAIEDLDQQITKLTASREAIKLLPDGLPGGVWATEHDLKLTLPYDFKLLSQARRMLGADWKFYMSNQTDEGNWQITYRHTGGTYLCVYLIAEALGATCRRVQVGEKIQPVYKVICERAAVPAA